MCSQLVAFVREHMWRKALLMGHSMRLEHTHNYKHIKYQRGVRADESKHTLGKRENNPYIIPTDQLKDIQTGNKNELKSH